MGLWLGLWVVLGLAAVAGGKGEEMREYGARLAAWLADQRAEEEHWACYGTGRQCDWHCGHACETRTAGGATAHCCAPLSGCGPGCFVPLSVLVSLLLLAVVVFAVLRLRRPATIVLPDPKTRPTQLETCSTQQDSGELRLQMAADGTGRDLDEKEIEAAKTARPKGPPPVAAPTEASTLLAAETPSVLGAKTAVQRTVVKEPAETPSVAGAKTAVHKTVARDQPTEIHSPSVMGAKTAVHKTEQKMIIQSAMESASVAGAKTAVHKTKVGDAPAAETNSVANAKTAVQRTAAVSGAKTAMG